MHKKLVNKLVEECSGNIAGNILNDYEKVCNSCTIYLLLFTIFLIIIISIIRVFIYFNWFLKRLILNVIPLKEQFIKHINGKY